MITLIYSLYGEDLKYHHGLLANVDLKQVYYPGSSMIVYHDGSELSFNTVREAQSLDPRVFNVTGVDMFPPVCYRLAAFHPATRPGPDLRRGPLVFRDADSRITHREAVAVQHWLARPEIVHAFADHPHHKQPLMGGMWGSKLVEYNVAQTWNDWSAQYVGDITGYSVDQYFLRDVIWPRVKTVAYRCDTFGTAGPRAPFPKSLTDGSGAFVGEVFSAGGVPRSTDRQIYSEALSKL